MFLVILWYQIVIPQSFMQFCRIEGLIRVAFWVQILFIFFLNTPFLCQTKCNNYHKQCLTFKVHQFNNVILLEYCTVQITTINVTCVFSWFIWLVVYSRWNVVFMTAISSSNSIKINQLYIYVICLCYQILWNSYLYRELNVLFRNLVPQ